MTTIPREVHIEQSIQNFVKREVADRGFPTARIEFKDSFEQREFGPDMVMDREYVALGFNYDQGGRLLELGSTLRQYSHNVEIFVIGTTFERGRALAYAIREALEAEAAIPLHNVLTGELIDHMLTDPVTVTRQVADNPQPWQEFFWLLRVPVLDETYPVAV